MNFDDIIKKTPSKLKNNERTAVGFLITISNGIVIDFIDEKTKSRLKEFADKLIVKNDDNYNIGVMTGTGVITLFAYFEMAKKDVTIWTAKARAARIELIAGADAVDGTAPRRCQKYKLFDFDLATPADPKIDFWRGEMKNLKNNIGIMLAWRAFITTLAKSYGIPQINKLTDFDDIYDALNKNNKEIFKTALFLGHGYTDPETIESLKLWQTAPIESLSWRPHTAEIEQFAKQMENPTPHNFADTFSHYLSRGLAQ